MKKFKLLITAALLMSLSSCGLFKKDCSCPHFSKLKPTPKFYISYPIIIWI